MCPEITMDVNGLGLPFPNSTATLLSVSVIAIIPLPRYVLRSLIV